MTQYNCLTLQLLQEGWTKNDTPPLCKPWNKWYGGWEYDYRQVSDFVFETPCGLLIQQADMDRSGYMSYMGVDWTEENDCSTIICPRYSRTEQCRLNHPLLEEHEAAGCHYEHLTFCAVHRTGRVYDYDHSVQKVIDQAKAEEEMLWDAFRASHGGRVCRHHSRYNRRTKTWSIMYNPRNCAHYAASCGHCSILDVDVDTTRANVYYDVKRSWTEPADGLIPEKRRMSVTKGYKVFEKNVPLTVCEAVVKYGRKDIREMFAQNHSWDMYQDHSLRLELINFRAKRVDTRDLMQDLEDVAAGIEVFHKTDNDKAITEQKNQRKEMAKLKKIARMEKDVISRFDELEEYRRKRIYKTLGEDRVYELRSTPKEEEFEQLSLLNGDG